MWFLHLTILAVILLGTAPFGLLISCLCWLPCFWLVTALAHSSHPRLVRCCASKVWIPVGSLLTVLVLANGPRLWHGNLLHLQSTRLTDRWQSVDWSVHPRSLHQGEPSRVFISLPTVATHGSVRIGDHTQALTSLGHGLFAWDWSQTPLLSRSGTLPARFEIGDRVFSVSMRIQVPGFRPEALCADSHGRRVLALCRLTDSAALVDPDGSVQQLRLGDGPRSAVCVQRGEHPRFLVGHAYEAAIWILDAERLTLIDKIPAPAGIIDADVAPTGRIAWLTDQHPAQVALGDAEGLSATWSLPYAADHCLWLDDEHLAVASSLAGRLDKFRLDSTGFTLVASSLMARPARDLCLQNGLLWFTCSGIDRQGQAPVGNHQIEHLLVGIDPTNWQRDRVFPLDRPSGRQVQAGSHDLGLDPMQITAWRNGLAIACSGSGHVALLDREGRLRHCPLPQNSCATPTQIAAIGEEWLVADPCTGVMAISQPEQASMTETRVLLIEPPTQQRTAWDDRLQRGEQLFYRSTRLGISCQSCHWRGDSDHAWHNIGTGPLPTLSIRSKGGTAPYLRTGSYRDLVHLHSSLRQLFRGHLRPVPGNSEDLAAWIGNLIARAPPGWYETELDTLRLGHQAFHKAACDTCHEGARFTNLSQWPQGWLFPGHHRATLTLDTPSLIGTGHRRQWLHDGRADSLSAIFDRWHAQGRHGEPEVLTEAERQALLLFLASL